MRSHIGWEGCGKPTPSGHILKTLGGGPKGKARRRLSASGGLELGWIVIPHRLGRVWKPLPSGRVLKTLRRIPKGKAQRG